jgi:hypothetical protein
MYEKPYRAMAVATAPKRMYLMPASAAPLSLLRRGMTAYRL